MNIHIDREEFNYLMGLKRVGIFTIGSKLYGLDDENSDTDYLVILYPFKPDTFSNHHQFQYKDIDNNIDYNFVDVNTFINNLVKGDSSCNLELLYSKKFKESELGWVLCDYTREFSTYNIIKAYLGLVDRDIRHFGKRKGRDIISGILHIQRGYETAKELFNNSFELITPELKKYKEQLIKSEDLVILFKMNLPILRDEIKKFRAEVNKKYEAGEMIRFLKPEIQMLIQDNVDYITSFYKPQPLSASLRRKIYNSNESINIEYK